MSKWLTYIGMSVLFALAGGAHFGPAAAAELLTTDPGHYANPGRALSGRGAALFDRTKQVRAGSNVVVRDDGALLERWVLNAGLSRACNQRRFRQKRDQYLIGVVDGRTFGAAVGGHSSLYDPAQMAENQVIYLFRGQGTTDCRVYHRTK
ncbi:MAG: hypothetical protein Kow00114_17180 [Kiloniellaceae bacterium]